MSVVIERISKEAIPKSLLLLADPSERQIDAYVQRGFTYIAKQEERIIGVYVLLETRPKTMEIMNIAVVEHMQGKGIGKGLLLHAIEKAKEYNMYKLEVGTGNSSISQLALYQKCGFRIFSIDFDYFSKHYEEEIIENGIVCRDMIRLAMELNKNV
ncbi:GNAT family N-acetyltransferase [Bacillus hominis]|uniref:GNAT family N-acetyltransferase n=1 Tax=Bacillus hominis TaxID=2817478 RepID=A0ABT7R6V7_9BACI|nr:GNAT family N-acetyltransferase [Bacillus hominis]MDM5192922.1 GNAT family N-acetyltransferase [Bacillus hominis]MDM5432664.1 GNAT family N-acetyltransferase [Bacillus hominis]MDM5438086.1 GNAT family N-acetyltransferase [Bacillus hominis]